MRDITNIISKAPGHIHTLLEDRKHFEGIVEDILHIIKEDTSKDISSFGEYLRETLKLLKEVSDPILYKVKRVASTQTFQARKNDIKT